MTFSLALWIVLAAITFWCVGVYNRLTRMRARYMDALGSVQKHMARLIGVARTLDRGSQPIHSNSADQLGAAPWLPLLEASERVDAAMQGCVKTLLELGSARELSQALATLDVHWHQWDDAPSDLAGPLIPEELRNQWDLAHQRVELSRGGLNQLIAKYNEAIQQFPARVLARMLGFRVAGTI